MAHDELTDVAHDELTDVATHCVHSFIGQWHTSGAQALPCLSCLCSTPHLRPGINEPTLPIHESARSIIDSNLHPGRRGPEAVQLQHHGGHERFHRLGQQRHTNATRPQTVVDQHSLDIAARITPLEVDTKVANALLGAVTAAALASKLASRDAGCRPPRQTPAPSLLTPCSWPWTLPRRWTLR